LQIQFSGLFKEKRSYPSATFSRLHLRGCGWWHWSEWRIHTAL